MPVIKGKTNAWLNPPRLREPINRAVERLAVHFPQPYNYPSYLGFNFRKRRMASELAEFDLLHHLRRGGAADEDVLVHAGEALIAGCKGGFPARCLPVEQPLLVTQTGFECLMKIIADMPAPDHHDPDQGEDR